MSKRIRSILAQILTITIRNKLKEAKLTHAIDLGIFQK